MSRPGRELLQWAIDNDGAPHDSDETRLVRRDAVLNTMGANPYTMSEDELFGWCASVITICLYWIAERSNIETMERLEKARHEMRHVAPDVQEKMPVAVMGALMRLASPHRTSHIQPGSSLWFTTDAPGTLPEIKEYIRTQVL